MSVITITIVESEQQLISGIPKFVIINTGTPATIFYTFDGTEPDTFSAVYIGGELNIPTDQNSVIFKVFATNGVDSSGVVERIYKTNITSIRMSHDQVVLTDDGQDNYFPYATVGPEDPVRWTTTGPNNLIVDKSNIQNIFDGYDGTATGTVAGGTDLPLTEYKIKFSESNSRGERAHGIGTLPAKASNIPEGAPPGSSHVESKLFNPRALVIFQDSRETPFDPNMVHINRQFFSLNKDEKYKDGILFNTTGIEGAAPTGSLLRSHFNPRENTITYYYFDSQSLRWIISKEPYSSSASGETGLQRIVFSSRESGLNKVFHWIPFKGSHLI